MMIFLTQLKFLPIKIGTAKVKKNLIVPMVFSIFSVTHCYGVTVGEVYGGGTVFCVSQTADTTQCVTTGSGNYGLIMANQDQVNYDTNAKHGVTWSSISSYTWATSADSGAANTAIIIAALPSDTPSSNAAWVCHNYRDPIEQHNDWYLPAKNELNKMYIYAKTNNLIGKGCTGSIVSGAQCLVGGYNDYKVYWSSTEYSGRPNQDAWDQGFGTGGQGSRHKVANYFGVRAIRAFNNLPIESFSGSSSSQMLGISSDEEVISSSYKHETSSSYESVSSEAVSLGAAGVTVLGALLANH